MNSVVVVIIIIIIGSQKTPCRYYKGQCMNSEVFNGEIMNSLFGQCDVKACGIYDYHSALRD
jgi:hypothetical protein